MFKEQDIRWFSDTVRAAYSTQDVAGLCRVISDALGPRFGLLASTCEEVGIAGSSYSLHHIVTQVRIPQDYAAYVHDNPMVPQSVVQRRLEIARLRETASMAQWARTDHFNALAKPMGFNDQMIVIAKQRATFVAFGLYRETMFCGDEQRLVHLLHRHLVAAWSRVRASSGEGGVLPLRLALDRDLRPLEPSPHVIRTLKSYFPDWQNPRALPEALSAWLGDSLEQLARRASMSPLRAFSVESLRGRLMVRCFPCPAEDRIQVVMIEEPASRNFLRLRRSGLTTRQCEVIHWVAQGKRDKEIAVILGLSPKTVGKHVENILKTLESGNRTGAIKNACALIDRLS